MSTSFALVLAAAGVFAAANGEFSPADAVLLDDYAACGPVSLFLVARMREIPATWPQVQELVGPSADDRTHSFLDLARAATALGLYPVALHCSWGQLRDLPMPAIIQVRDVNIPGDPPHLLVLLRPESDGAILLDAPQPTYFLPATRFADVWTGNILIFPGTAAAAAAYQPNTSRSALIRVSVWALALGGAACFLVAVCRRWQGGTRRLGHLLSANRATVARACVVLIVCGAAVTWIWFRKTAAKSPSPPRCAFEQAALALGELAPGTTVMPITLRNDGDETLTISAVRSTCACVVSKAPRSIDPRRRAQLDLELTVTPGPRSVQLTVESNDPEGPKHLVLAWHGTAKPHLFPIRIDAAAVPLGETYQRTIRLIYPGGKSAIVPELVRFECDSPSVALRVGTNNPLAVRYGLSGMLVGIIGEQELRLRIEQPPEPGLFEAHGKLILKYGASTVNLELPISLNYYGGEVMPDVSGVVFAAPRQENLLGQERRVGLGTQGSSNMFNIYGAPTWLACRVDSDSKRGASLYFKVTGPLPDRFMSSKVFVGRAGSRLQSTSVAVSAISLER